jgi:hypothetical protein
MGNIPAYRLFRALVMDGTFDQEANEKKQEFVIYVQQ